MDAIDGRVRRSPVTPEISVDGFNRWIETAKHGDTIIYARGLLMDREAPEVAVRLGRQALHAAGFRFAKGEWQQTQTPLVSLTQRKVAPFRYEYIATRLQVIMNALPSQSSEAVKA